MATVNWGMLTKSQVDDETIEEAILRLIGEHNENEEAHLGEGQSLQSHKVSEIIDHRIASIIADKIKNYEVDVEKLTINKVYYASSFESLDGWQIPNPERIETQFGLVRLTTCEVANTVTQIFTYSDYLGIDFGLKNPVYETILRLDYNVTQLAYFGIGSLFSNFIGFKIVDSILYAYYEIDEEPHAYQISDVDIKKWHNYRFIAESGGKIKYYIDGILRIEVDNPFPSTEEDYFNMFKYYIKNTVAGEKTMFITNCRFFQDS